MILGYSHVIQTSFTIKNLLFYALNVRKHWKMMENQTQWRFGGLFLWFYTVRFNDVVNFIHKQVPLVLSNHFLDRSSPHFFFLIENK